MGKGKEKKRVNYRLIYDAIIMILLIAFDRFLKIYAVRKLKDHPSKSIIKGILELNYIENTGAAFGLLEGQRFFFVLVSVIIFAAIVYLVIRMPAKKKFLFAHIALSLLAAGSMGNMTDRLLYDHVIDYIYFSSIHFPVFNLADLYVLLATVVLVILLLFVYKEDDLNFLRFKEKRLREID